MTDTGGAHGLTGGYTSIMHQQEQRLKGVINVLRNVRGRREEHRDHPGCKETALARETVQQ